MEELSPIQYIQAIRLPFANLQENISKLCGEQILQVFLSDVIVKVSCSPQWSAFAKGGIILQNLTELTDIT